MVIYHLIVLVDHPVHADQATFCDFVSQIAVKFREGTSILLLLCLADAKKDEAKGKDNENLLHGWNWGLLGVCFREKFKKKDWMWICFYGFFTK
jgi:hypothetical protein